MVLELQTQESVIAVMEKQAEQAGATIKDRSAVDSRNDSYDLQNADHLGLILVSVLLNGENYLSWSRAMIIALRAKDKLLFINGKITMPEADSPSFEKWRKVDSMVVSWILNTMSKEIVEAFLYTPSVNDFWEELQHRLGDCNGPFLFQIKKNICALIQGNMSLMMYFIKMKKKWDEWSCLRPLSEYTCGADKS